LTSSPCPLRVRGALRAGARRALDDRAIERPRISPNTARTHAERVRRKLGVARRTEVAAALAER
jgi:hypothetical protein